MKKISFSRFVCWVFLVATIWTAISIGKWEKKSILKWDVSTYYLYLPATFLYQDLFHLEFYPAIDSAYHPSNHVKKYAITPYSLTKKKIIKYPLGVSLFELPGFAGATLWSSLDSRYSPDGWSEPYQLAIALNSILFVFLGLILLRRFLRSYFSDMTTAVTLIIIAFGTNLYLYSAIEPGLSHPYLFFLFGAILWITQKWYQQPSVFYSLMLGLSVGLVTVTRPTGILIAIFPLLWQSTACSSYSARLATWKREWKNCIIAIGCFMIPLLLQMTYWKATTGYWFYYSYEEEGFSFTNWHIIDGLFSYRKGWFIYTPLAILGFIGLYFIWKKKSLQFYLLPFTFYFLLTLWLTFSWWMWWYGGGFGSRVMIESLVILALPLAALTKRILRSGYLLKSVFILILVTGISLNLFQSWQYNKAIIHWDSMNKKYYWKVFGKTKISDEDLNLLGN